MRWPAAVIAAMTKSAPTVAASSATASSGAVAIDANARRLIEIEAEYFGLMYALTDKQKIVPDDVRLIQKFKQSRTVSDELHARVLGKLGMTVAKFESIKHFEEAAGGDDEDVCVICMDEKPNAVFRPCGHLKCCEDCAITVKDCPMCRKKIVEVVKVFR